MRSQLHRQPYIYVRLSKEDLSDRAEPMELKLEKRRLIAQGLAAQWEQVIPDENMICEVVSAKSIEGRQGFQRILERSHAGEVSHLFTPYFDRLLRGSKRDEADAEDAFKAGSVVVVSTEGVLDFGDANFDVSQGLAFTVRNAVSRQYLYDLSKKLRETNLIRTRKGQRSAGFAPFGYQWIPASYRNKQLIEEGRYEIIECEYAVIQEIFRRIRQEGARAITADLNLRFRTIGSPRPPSASNRLGWNHSTIFSIVNNPFYCGFPAHRFENRRGRRFVLDRSDWVSCDERLSYPCPVTPDVWEQLQALISSRKRVGTPKTNKQSLLTGLLFCSNGRNMVNKVGYYSCTCREYGTPHKAMAISEPKINEVATGLIETALVSLPEKLIKRSAQRIDRTTAQKSYSEALTRLQEARQVRSDLMQFATSHIRIYGAEAYEGVCRENRLTIDRLEQQATLLQDEIRTPDVSEVAPLLQSMRKFGFRVFWEEATILEKRRITSLVLLRITLVEPDVRYVSSVVVQPHEWLSAYVKLPERVQMPLRVAKR